MSLPNRKMFPSPIKDELQNTVYVLAFHYCIGKSLKINSFSCTILRLSISKGYEDTERKVWHLCKLVNGDSYWPFCLCYRLSELYSHKHTITTTFHVHPYASNPNYSSSFATVNTPRNILSISAAASQNAQKKICCIYPITWPKHLQEFAAEHFQERAELVVLLACVYYINGGFNIGDPAVCVLFDFCSWSWMKYTKKLVRN